MADDPCLDRQTPLRPGNAVAAILQVENQYLLQLRDNKRGIFFPGHWGCFGGGVEPDESLAQALTRELNEELGLDVDASVARYFTRFDFDLGFVGLAPIWRNFYEITLASTVFPKLRLREGKDMRLFSAEAILTGAIALTPYDSFALWLHINRGRLIA
jgi:8-oxo-dGTP pyrophosphatase MutT (NUDIX family)